MPWKRSGNTLLIDISVDEMNEVNLLKTRLNDIKVIVTKKNKNK